ncbi:MAG: sigma-70 family RNA polymerase sigma factor [Rhodobiaceae bacterium]
MARNKNRDAFAELFEYFAPRLKGYLLRLGTSEGQAEEVAQEAMLSVWRKAHLFNRKLAAPSTWIFTIARNRRIDILRRQRFPEIDPDDPTLVPENPPQPDDEIIVARQGESVRAALENLPDEQRELVRLAFYSGWSHSEIANRTNLPLGTVKSRLRLAFARLRNELDGRL